MDNLKYLIKIEEEEINYLMDKRMYNILYEKEKINYKWYNRFF